MSYQQQLPTINIIVDAIQKAKEATLGRETSRCADHRKAIFIMYKTLLDCEADKTLLKLFETGVELSEH